MRQFAAVSGRDPASLDTSLLALWYRMDETLENDDGERMAFTGNVEAIIDDIGRYEEAGLNHLVIGFESDDCNNRSIGSMLCRNVVPKYRGAALMSVEHLDSEIS